MWFKSSRLRATAGLLRLLAAGLPYERMATPDEDTCGLRFGSRRGILWHQSRRPGEVSRKGDKMKRIVLLFAIALAVAVVPALADVNPTGTGGLPGDWGQQWQENGVGNFNSVEWYVASGSPLQAPGLGDFTGTNWSVTYLQGDGGAAFAVGDVTTDMLFTTAFVDPQIPSQYYFYADLNGVIVDNYLITNDGTGWTAIVQGGAPVPPPAYRSRLRFCSPVPCCWAHPACSNGG
jgi:hypothetical protein